MDSTLDNQLVGIKISKLAKRLDRMLEQEIRALGLKRGQHTILLAVADLESPNFTELAQRLEVDKAAVTRSAASCENRGWLKSYYAPGSFKTKQVSLTKSGHTLTKKIKVALISVEQQLKSELSTQLYCAIQQEVL